MCYKLLLDALLFDVTDGEVAAEAGEGVAGKRADEDADDDVAEVVLAHEYAADRYHEGPEEHPIAIGLEPCRHTGSWGLTVRL